MVCFCKQSAAALTAAVEVMASADLSLSVQSAASLRISAIANWLSARSLPAAPWAADPLWLELDLPSPRLSLSAMATLSAMAQARAQAMALFNIDLLASASATAMVRLAATLDARLSAMLSLSAAADLSITASAWLKLAAELEASVSVSAAASLGLFLPTPELSLAYLSPGGIELSVWAPFLSAVASLSPLIAISLQLGITDSASLSLAVKAILAIDVQVIANFSLAAQLMAALSAVARLQLALGVNVVAEGYASVSAMVALRVQAALALLPPNPQPPRLSVCPTILAPAAVVSAAASAEIALLADLDWNVPALPALPGLANLSLALGLSASLAVVAPTLTAPCLVCDAAALLKAL